MATMVRLALAHAHQLGPLEQRRPLLTLPGALALRPRRTAALAPTPHGAQDQRRPPMAYRHPLPAHQTTTLGATHQPLTHPRPELDWVLLLLARRSTHPRRAPTMHLHLVRSMRLRRVAGKVAGVRMLHQHLGPRQHLHLERAAGITVHLRLVLMVLRRRRRPVDPGILMMIERTLDYREREGY